jgi:hypothetical protein
MFKQMAGVDSTKKKRIRAVEDTDERRLGDMDDEIDDTYRGLQERLEQAREYEKQHKRERDQLFRDLMRLDRERTQLVRHMMATVSFTAKTEKKAKVLMCSSCDHCEGCTAKNVRGCDICRRPLCDDCTATTKEMRRRLCDNCYEDSNEQKDAIAEDDAVEKKEMVAVATKKKKKKT